MQGRTLAGRYRLESPLGRGGMGEVWKAADLRLNRTVAVKILSLNGVPGQAVARFRREAEIAGGLQHPGIAVVFDIDTDGDVLYLVMELLDGTDLAKVAKRHPDGLPVGRALTLLAQVADALAEAHAKGIIHRDIKPANVMLLKGDRTKVLDFGIARYSEQTTDLTGSAAIGTPAFMSPEQFDRAIGVDHRTDLYALGALAYELLTGRRPFTAETIRQLLHDILFTPAPAVRDLRPEIPPALDGLVAELLAKEPRDRPQDARTVAERLRAIAPHSHPRPAAEPVPRTPDEIAPTPPAAPPTRTLPKPKTSRRRKLLGMALLLSLSPSALLAFVAFLDRGDFRTKPACDHIRPSIDGDSAPDSAAVTGAGAPDCHWRKEEGESEDKHTWDLRAKMSIYSSNPWRGRMAPDVAEDHLKKMWQGKPSPRPEKFTSGIRTTTGMYYYDGTGDRHVVVFRISNLIVNLSYQQRGYDITRDEAESMAIATARSMADALTP